MYAPADYSRDRPITRESGTTTKNLGRVLWIVVTVLGLTVFAVSAGTSATADFSVRLAVLAAVVAAVGLLPRQDGRGWIVVALSVTGSLDALHAWIAVSSPDWALSVILVLEVLQSLAAVGGLLSDGGMVRASAVGGQDYSAYANFTAAYQAYIMQYQQASMPYYAAGQGSAHAQAAAEATAAAPGTSTNASQESEALRARYAQYAGSSTSPGANAAQGEQAGEQWVSDPGLPGAVNGVPDPRQQRSQQEYPGATASS